MALDSLFCADVPLRNCSLTLIYLLQKHAHARTGPRPGQPLCCLYQNVAPGTNDTRWGEFDRPSLAAGAVPSRHGRSRKLIQSNREFAHLYFGFIQLVSQLIFLCNTHQRAAVPLRNCSLTHSYLPLAKAHTCPYWPAPRPAALLPIYKRRFRHKLYSMRGRWSPLSGSRCTPPPSTRLQS